MGETKRARADLERLLRNRPSDLHGHFARGTLRFLDGDYNGAVTDLSQAIKNSILGSFALALRGRAWLGLGDRGLSGATTDAIALVRLRP
jgi:hypothetical protein